MAAITRRQMVLGCGVACGARAWAEPDSADHHALLVGVGQVDALPSRLWLQGPDNDVALMRDSLLARGFEPAKVQVLSTALPPAERPTMGALHQAMARLERLASSSSRYVVYFAGHGAQVPQAKDRAGAESDGREEVLLLADVQRWRGDAHTGELPNALRDEELAAWVDRLTVRGAQVWVFLDTCHAAGFVRGAFSHDSERVRAVAATELGVPLPEWQERGAGLAERSPSRPAPARRGRGLSDLRPPNLTRRVYAMASRANEAAIEERWPKGNTNGGKMHGSFTWHLADLIRAGAFVDAASLRSQLQQRLLADGRVAPVPQVLGDARLRWGR